MQQIIEYLFVMNMTYTGKTTFNINGWIVLNVYIMYIKIVGKKAIFPL